MVIKRTFLESSFKVARFYLFTRRLHLWVARFDMKKSTDYILEDFTSIKK